MMQAPTSSTSVCPSYTEKARRHKDGSVLLSIANDRICKLNGVGALTWMILEESSAGLRVDDVVLQLSDQFAAINAEGELQYQVSHEQLRSDTAQFLKKVSEMKLLRIETDSSGCEFYHINESVSATTSNTVSITAPHSRDNVSSTTVQREQFVRAATQSEPVRLSKRETFAAFVGLLSFDLLLKFRGFHALITKVEHWPTKQPHRTDPELCNRVRATVDRAQMYYPKKAMCLQHSAVLTCLLRRSGVPAELVLAAQEFPPKGHAWSEVDGVVINDLQSVKNNHRVLRRI
jgi:hypothetical protein